MTQGRNPEQEPAHDVLAAEAFAMPAPDPRLRHRPFIVPDDPSGISEPHDILAAEEFAMPARGEAERTTFACGAESSWWSALGAAAALLALVGLRRLRRVT